MGLFFQKRENVKSTKISIARHILVVVVMIFLLVMAIINGFDPFFVKLFYIVAALSWFIDGVESYLLKENRKVYLLDFTFALVWILLFFLYPN